jgi:hypothetical protein
MGTTMHGACLCGAVSFEAEPERPEVHACHCEMCRRWTGSALMCVSVKPAAIRFEGAEHIERFRSSDWAERAWCGRCGSTLYYHLTAGPPERESYEMAMGLFNRPDDFALTLEIFSDCRPACLALAGEHRTMTRAEVLARFAGEGSA